MDSTLRKLLIGTAVALAGCSGGDAGNPDAGGMPPPPVLGAQIDRAGRASISTMLIGVFTPEPTRTALRDAYHQASDPATWRTTMLPTLPNSVSIERELATNLAMFDALDIGMELSDQSTGSCGNAIRYDGPPKAASYLVTAGLFADDQLYLDTRYPTCNVYFDIEIEYGSSLGISYTECGGRMPGHDAIDMTYSILAAGISGLDLNPGPLFKAPLFHDGAPVHTDLNDRFPFLGPPH